MTFHVANALGHRSKERNTEYRRALGVFVSAYCHWLIRKENVSSWDAGGAAAGAGAASAPASNNMYTTVSQSN